MPRGIPHPAVLRAQVVAAVAGGASHAAAAKQFGVGKATVERWYREDGPIQPTYARTREELGRLVYDLVADNIETLSLQARFARREDWLAQQSAADVAELVATISDRTIRLLAAFRPANEAIAEGNMEARGLPEGSVG
jgi:transposase-like protein